MIRSDMKNFVVRLLTAFLIFCALIVSGEDDKVVNGGFTNGLNGWQATGNFYLQTNIPDGKVSACI